MHNEIDDVDPNEMRRRFREIFDALYRKSTKPHDLKLRTTPSQKPAPVTPAKSRQA
jgi:hypothetical protein